MSDANSEICRGPATWAQPQCFFKVLDCNVSLPIPQPDPAAPRPTNGETWIELECPIDEGESRIDVSLEVAKHMGSFPENKRVVRGCSQRPTGIVDPLLAHPILILVPSIRMRKDVTAGDQHESRAIVRVAFESLPEQIERTQHALFVPGLPRGSCPQKQVIGGQIIGRTMGRTKRFRRLQGRFDHASDTQRDAVLKFEDVLHRAVKMISPQMRDADRVDQLRGYAHAVARLANRTLQHVANAKFATNLLHIDRPALVGEARITRDHEEPSDTAE